jgi:hypothetical protein
MLAVLASFAISISHASGLRRELRAFRKEIPGMGRRTVQVEFKLTAASTTVPAPPFIRVKLAVGQNESDR